MTAEQLEALRVALADRYQIERELGRGGMATVYLAMDRKHRRAVAVKVLRADVTDELGAERFLREIETVAGLTHPHILPLHDSGEAAGCLYYVMPYIAGETLRDRIRREGQLPLPDALRIARNVAHALGHAHAHGVVHRDIKPANILISGGYAVVSDFGIARAVSAARGAEAEEGGGTAAGPLKAFGTPTYMSPEQCLGSSRVDGRSDLYSLGVVLYEMLAGHPPFDGDSPAELTAQHVSDAPPALERSGRDLPPEVERVVRTALAKAPADRFATAHEFAEALPEPADVRASGAARRPSQEVRLRRRRSWPLVAAAILIMLAVGAFAVSPRYRPIEGLDAELYAVLPFGHRGGAAQELIDGDACESLLYEGLSRWTDLRLVNLLRVSDMKAQVGDSILDFESATTIARRLGAGRMVWGEVRRTRHLITVHAAIYDVTRRDPVVVREASVRLGAAADGVGQVFNALADSLMVGGRGTALSARGATGTDQLAAWRAYQDGHEAVERWQLAAAESAFVRALEVDPGYAHAHLWLGQVLAWQGRPAADARPHAAAALRARGLDPREAASARALVELADGRYPQACAEYEALIERDSLDFGAWFGRGRCLSEDDLVVRDAASPSGWRFRSSHHAAVESFGRALAVMPSAHRAFRGDALARLMRYLHLDAKRFRLGYAPGPDTLRFVSFAELSGDTLVTPAHPFEAMRDGRIGPSTEAHYAAIARNRSRFSELTAHWLRAFPGQVDVLEAAAVGAELGGKLRVLARGEPGALELYREAAGRATDPMQRRRLRSAQVRVLVKLGLFEPARALADSMLATEDVDLDASSSVRFAALAALTGRPSRAAGLLMRGASAYEAFDERGALVPMPPALASNALGLLSYAAIGVPVDTIHAKVALAQTLVRSAASGREQARVMYAAFNGPFALAYAAVGRTPLHLANSSSHMLRWQHAAAVGDTTTFFAARDRVLERSRKRLPEPLSPEWSYQFATALAQEGDTAHATELLDLTLSSLGALSLDVVGDVPMISIPQAAGLGRVMSLRARLASLSGDRATARRWASAVVSLWSSAEPALGAELAEMRRLAVQR
jgi:tetratricopeptide (TPR) repeat protein